MLNKIYEQYQTQAQFYVVYIQEAHASDMWQTQSNVKQGVLFTTPKSADERTDVAGACVRKLGIKIPALIDGLDDRVEKAYTGWPDRLYVIGRDGRVAFKSAAGPFGFKPAPMEEALKQAIAAR